MKALFKHCVVLALLVAVLVAQNRKTDGASWRGLTNGERVEFVAGYIDCYANDLGDKNNTFPESWYTYAPRITSWYEQHPQAQAIPATKVLFLVTSKHPPSLPEGGETWTKGHWFFDGDYWNQMSSQEQPAYIDGYLACFSEHLSSRGIKFSKPLSFYVTSISQWYDAVPVTATKAFRKRQKVAIALVLRKFQDASPNT